MSPLSGSLVSRSYVSFVWQSVCIGVLPSNHLKCNRGVHNRCPSIDH